MIHDSIVCEGMCPSCSPLSSPAATGIWAPKTKGIKMAMSVVAQRERWVTVLTAYI